MLHKEAKVKIPINQGILYLSENRKVLLISLLLCYYLICFKYASLCNLIKSVHILRNYTGSKQKRFKKINKMILPFVKKMLF